MSSYIDLKAIIAALRKEVESLQQRIKDLESQLSSERFSNSRRVSELEGLLRSKDSELLGLKSDNSRLLSQVGSLQTSLRSTSTTTTIEIQLRSELEILRKESRQHKDQFEGSQRENGELKQRINQLQSQIDQLARNSHSQQGDRHDLESEISRLRTQNSKLQSDFDTLAASKTADLAEANQKIAKLKGDLQSVQDGGTQHLHESKILLDMKGLLESEHSRLDSIRLIEQLKSEVKEEKWKYEKSEQAASQLQKELKEARDERDRFRQAHENETKLKFQVDQMSKDLNARDERLSQLTHNYAILSAKYNELSELSSRKDTYSRDDEAYSIVKEDNENLKKVNSRLLQELNELRAENSNLRNQRPSFQPGREYQELSTKLMLLENKMASDKENGR